MQHEHTWAVVLAGGEGKRLAALTADAQGRHVPKQFCSLDGETSLLELALARAKSLVPADHVCVVVAKDHERWWQPLAEDIHAGNLIVQPRNRGTGNGALLALSYILKRDPSARLLFLPADHHALDESPLVHAMASILSCMPAESKDMFLLGIAPDDASPDLGYIIPQNAAHHGAHGVRHFIEKPSRGVAGKLIQQGGLWNSGIFAANGDSLLNLFRKRFPDNVIGFQTAMARTSSPLPIYPARALIQLYERLAEVDLSHQLFQFYVTDLRVGVVPHCGWSDLGTPERVSERVSQLAAQPDHPAPSPAQTPYLNLAEAVSQAQQQDAPLRAAG